MTDGAVGERVDDLRVAYGKWRAAMADEFEPGQAAVNELLLSACALLATIDAGPKTIPDPRLSGGENVVTRGTTDAKARPAAVLHHTWGGEQETLDGIREFVHRHDAGQKEQAATKQAAREAEKDAEIARLKAEVCDLDAEVRDRRRNQVALSDKVAVLRGAVNELDDVTSGVPVGLRRKRPEKERIDQARAQVVCAARHVCQPPDPACEDVCADPTEDLDALRRERNGCCETAAQFARNEAYWRERAENAEGRVRDLIGAVALSPSQERIAEDACGFMIGGEAHRPGCHCHPCRTLRDHYEDLAQDAEAEKPDAPAQPDLPATTACPSCGGMAFVVQDVDGVTTSCPKCGKWIWRLGEPARLVEVPTAASAAGSVGAAEASQDEAPDAPEGGEGND